MNKSPSVAVVTNLAPNHLDIHTSMSEYIAAKENIFMHQGTEGKAVFNFDNEITKAFASKAKGRVVPFSRKESLPGGIYVKDGSIWSGREGFKREILPLADILLPGDHNVENYMAAIGAVEGLVSDQVIRDFAASFTGVEHRIELVRTLDGVKYYNDSIATSPTRTIAGLRCFPEKVILIAGGYDKHLSFTGLGKEIVERVKTLILTGDTAGQIRDAVKSAAGYAEGAPDIMEADEFETAVRTARDIAQPGDVVLLSPACAAFDRFKNFAVRGESFKRTLSIPYNFSFPLKGVSFLDIFWIPCGGLCNAPGPSGFERAGGGRDGVLTAIFRRGADRPPRQRDRRQTLRRPERKNFC
jgi:UDP-N-acetylmuramoylalanine--D-glutamate ligase